jgi:hypothetical protein
MERESNRRTIALGSCGSGAELRIDVPEQTARASALRASGRPTEPSRFRVPIVSIKCRPNEWLIDPLTGTGMKDFETGLLLMSDRDGVMCLSESTLQWLEQNSVFGVDNGKPRAAQRL